jgi:hypothetical protein
MNHRRRTNKIKICQKIWAADFLIFYLTSAITESCLKSKPLQENQHSYQKGKSTNSAIHKVTQYIESGLNNREPVLGVFLDIEGAFDRTKYEAIKKSAQEHAVPFPIIDWVSNMLKHRTLRADLKGTCVRMTPTRGCPQGGIASPLFWIMVADSLTKRLKDSGFYTIGYADDFAILVKGKFVGTVFHRMRFAMKIVEKWCVEEGLSVNPRKTSAILFTRKRIIGSHNDVILFGEALTLVDQVKYLGIIDR